jgi:predicted lipoprotein
LRQSKQNKVGSSRRQKEVVQAESRARAVTISIDADDEDQIIKKELRKEQKLI